MNTIFPDFDRINALFAGKKEQFARFRELLLEYNARFNLTAITGEQEIHYKHFVDSLAGEGYFPQGANCAEVGSGAGFPSVPLMIARPDLSFTLIESTGKKCEFLKVAVRELSLHAEVVCARAEECGKNQLYREKFDVVCARAVARLNSLAEYCLPLVKRGGSFVAYKGSSEEIAEAKNALRALGGGEPVVAEYALPEGYGARTLVAVGKIGNTPEKYPRGNGAERRKPIL